MHDAALAAADAAHDIVKPALLYLTGKVGVADGLASDAYHVDAAVGYDGIGQLGVGNTAHGHDRDIDALLDLRGILDLIAGVQIGGADAVFDASVGGHADVDGVDTLALAHTAYSFDFLNLKAAHDLLGATDADYKGIVAAELLLNALDDEAQETHAVVERTAELVRALVGVTGQELGRQITVGRVDLDAVKAHLLRPFSSLYIGIHHLVDLFGAHLMGHGLAVGARDLRGAHRLNAVGIMQLGLAAGMTQLHEDFCTRLVYGAGEAPIAGYKLVAPDTALVDKRLALDADGGALRDDEPEASLGSLGVILYELFSRFSVVLCKIRSHSGDEQAVLELNAADLKRRKQVFVFVHDTLSFLFSGIAF